MRRLPAIAASILLVTVVAAIWLAPPGEASRVAPVVSRPVAASQATPARPEALAPIILKWTTKSEVNTAGFNVYRAMASDGPYAMINRDLIPASNDAIAGGQYVYTDTTAIAGVTYYYQLEDVEMSGRRTRHDPFRITAAAAGASSGPDIDTAAITVLVIAAAGLAGAIAWRIRSK